VLKIDRDGTGILITLPRRTGREAALAFATDQADWIERRLRHTPAPVSFAAGNTVPLRGEMHVIGHRPHQSQSIEREPGSAQRPPALWVKGEAPHLARRLRDWLKSEARRDLIALCRRHAAAMGVEFRRLTVRDQTSRWGSCSASGALSFSWRLILAPRDILEYVVVHEVAHLVEMNHGPRFWSLVDRNFPDRRHARIWLRRHGPILHSYR
jgi:predicted metal-dependent hydrolase